MIDPSPVRPLTAAVAGAGSMARQHLKVLESMRPEVRPVAVADPSAARLEEVLADHPRLRGFRSVEEMLSETKVDVLHVCTPMETHVGLATAGLGNGAHVYVEKPFAPSAEEAEGLLRLAEAERRLLCAGHQILFEPPYRSLVDLLPAIGTPVHVESYFTFRPVRTGGARPLSFPEQLLDVLPHPTYLLIDVLARMHASAGGVSTNGARPAGPEIAALEVSQGATIHAVVRHGEVRGTLVASLEGRPVEHWLRVVGSRGQVHADFVRGTVQRLLGPGASAIDKALNPFRLASQLSIGTAGALWRRTARRGSSYPGLEGIFEAFYEAVRTEGASPTPPDQIVATSAVGARAAEIMAQDAPRTKAEGSIPRDVLVTGGTGLLGREVVAELRRRGLSVRAVSRRPPPPRRRDPDVEYAQADLSQPLDHDLMKGVRFVVHCAAETAGGRDAHRRNSIEATENVLRAAASVSVETFVHVSSVAVLAARRKGAPIEDDDPVHPRPEELGPYVWGKAESEVAARRLGHTLGVRVRVVRPVPLVDRRDFEPPGRLGRRIGNLFVAVGNPSEPLTVAEVTDTARAVARVALAGEDAPPAMNLAPATPPTRRELVRAAKRACPELTVVWLPRNLFRVLAGGATVLQKVVRPRTEPVRIASAFETLRYRPAASLVWMDAEAEGESPAVEVADPDHPDRVEPSPGRAPRDRPSPSRSAIAPRRARARRAGKRASEGASRGDPAG